VTPPTKRHPHPGVPPPLCPLPRSPVLGPPAAPAPPRPPYLAATAAAEKATAHTNQPRCDTPTTYPAHHPPAAHDFDGTSATLPCRAHHRVVTVASHHPKSPLLCLSIRREPSCYLATMLCHRLSAPTPCLIHFNWAEPHGRLFDSTLYNT
jgi:hypothetical protein